MTTPIAKRKWPFVFASTLIVALLFSAAVFSAKPQPQQPQQPQPKKRKGPKETPVTSMPQVFSKVKTIEIVRTWIQDPDTPHVSAAVEIRNNSDKAVMAVDLMCGEGAITKNGLTDEENPIVVIEPHGTTIVEMNFGSMTFGAPLVIAGVVYQDGTEEGAEESLKAMRLLRAHDRKVIKAKKESDAQKGATKP